MVPPLKYQCEVRVPEKIGCEPQEKEIGAGEVREGFLEEARPYVQEDLGSRWGRQEYREAHLVGDSVSKEQAGEASTG